MKVLDIGCGVNKVEGSIGVDVVKMPGVDVVHDLSLIPWPFEDDEFSTVIANHFLEHCTDIVSVLAITITAQLNLELNLEDFCLQLLMRS